MCRSAQDWCLELSGEVGGEEAKTMDWDGSFHKFCSRRERGNGVTTRWGMSETGVLEMGNKEHYMKKKKKNFWLFPILYPLLTLKFALQVQRPESQTKMVSCLIPLLWPALSGITSPHFSLIIIKPPSSLPSHPPETIMTDQSGTSMFIWIKMYKHPPALTRCNLCRGCQRDIRVEPIGPFLRCMK